MPDKLLTETNTPHATRMVMKAAIRDLQFKLDHNKLDVAFEHGQHWVTCKNCGAQWSAADSTPGDFVFEEVSHGDEWCQQEAARIAAVRRKESGHGG